MYRTEVVHVNEEDFKSNITMYLQKIEIDGEIIAVHQEESISYLVPGWMLDKFIKEQVQRSS